MKKMIAFILTLAAVFSLAACGSGTAEVVTVPTETPAAEVTPTAETPAVESGEAWYELQNDDTILTVRLPSNPSTGYDWSYEISNGQAIELLTQEYVQDEAAPDAVGVGGTWVASFANFGSAFGEVTISFRYARSWEDNEPAEVRTLHLHIVENSQIEVISADPAVSE